MLRAPSRSPLAHLIANVLIVVMVAASVPVTASASVPAEAASLTKTAFGELIAHTGADPQPYAFAGEPYDPNSGFQYHRARWMDPRMGRFAGMDSAPAADVHPQSLNRYLYAFNDPATLVDRTGLRPTSIHNRILDAALSSDLNRWDIIDLKRFSAEQDHQLAAQLPQYAHEHAMRGSERQSVDEGRALYENFLEDNLKISKVRMTNRAFDPARLRYLGMNLHAVMDNTSPSHAGFQVWSRDPVGILAHIGGESRINATQLQFAVDAVQKEYRRHVEEANRFERQISVSGIGLQGFGDFSSSIIGFAAFTGFF